MSILEQFKKDDLDFLVALPYRTGLWVSVCDESGGHEADHAELQVLESIIYGFASDFCKSEVTEALMKKTVACRGDWKDWDKNIENVPQECRRGIEILAEYTDYKNVAAFKENLMEIAFAVAMAYREFDDDVSLVEKITMYWHFLADRAMALVKHRAPKNHDEIFNISRAERLALTELSDSLRRDEKEGREVIDVYAEENIDPAILEKIARQKENEAAKAAEAKAEEAKAAETDVLPEEDIAQTEQVDKPEERKAKEE